MKTLLYIPAFIFFYALLYIGFTIMTIGVGVLEVAMWGGDILNKEKE